MKKLITSLALVSVLATAVMITSPAARMWSRSVWRNKLGWSQKAREADPIGYLNHAEKTLRKDLGKIESDRRALKAEVIELDAAVRENETKIELATALAEKFRVRYQAANLGDYPIVVRGAAYTKAQVRKQVAALLKEARSKSAVVKRLRHFRELADKQLEKLAGRQDETVSQLALMPVRKSLISARKIDDRGRQVAAEIADAMRENEEVINHNPVRPLKELLAAQPASDTPDEQLVQRFLGK